MTQAALGAEVLIDTMDGEERIRVEPGTDSGTVVRLKGKGVPNVNRRGRGDVYVTLHVVTLKSPSRDEKRLLEQLADLRRERRTKADPSRGELRRPEF
jgi:molecular chaperone DnaJ